MSGSNFKFLEKDYTRLAKLGDSAEAYVYSDPQAALVKLRCFTESLVGHIYSILSIEIEPQADLYKRLNHYDFKDVVDHSIIAKLHALRMHGNKAAHDNIEHSTNQVLWLIKEAFLVGKWFVRTMLNSPVELPDYVEPKPIESVHNEVFAQNEALQVKLTNNSAALAEAETELEALRTELETVQKNVVARHNNDELAAFKAASSESASSFDLQMNVTRKNINIFDCYKQHSLTAGQRNLVEQLNEFLNQSNESVFLLKGYAGTGKTFITEGLTQYLNAIGRQFELMAPTGKAAKVISDKTGQAASTIHRVIYNYENVKEYKLEGIEGSETFRCYAEIKVNQSTSEAVYIIDESSMLSDTYSDSEFFRFGSGYLLKDLLNYINLDHNEHQKKVIFIGDNAQLPPVGMGFSPALSKRYLFDKYRLASKECELSEVVRQKTESGVMNNARILREAMHANLFNKLEFQVNNLDVQALTSDVLLNTFLKVCNNKISNTKNAILIASSNAQVSQYNRVVREHFFPSQLQVVSGDKIISVANHYVNQKVIANGEFGMVRQVLSAPEIRNVVLRKKGEDGETITISVELQFRDVELGFRDEYGNASFFRSKIVENLLYSDEPALSSDEHKALYVDFCNRHADLRTKAKRNEFRMALLSDPYFNAFKVKFGYAITCHKAQGSEWQNVFVKCSSHLKTLSQDYFRWLYTAITRTSSQLYVIDPPMVKLGSTIKRVGGSSSASTPVNTMSTTTNDSLVGNKQELATTVNIPEGNVFLAQLFAEIKSALIGTNVEIQNITHNQYQEVYLFQLAEEYATARIAYNSKQKISSIAFNQDSPLDELIKARLNYLEGILISGYTDTKPSQLEFPEEFLKEFHEKLSEVFTLNDISIPEVRARSFAQRYCFQKFNEIAVVDIYYNGKSQFTKFMGQKNLSSSLEFLDTVENLIEEALN